MRRCAGSREPTVHPRGTVIGAPRRCRSGGAEAGRSGCERLTAVMATLATGISVHMHHLLPKGRHSSHIRALGCTKTVSDLTGGLEHPPPSARDQNRWASYAGASATFKTPEAFPAVSRSPRGVGCKASAAVGRGSAAGHHECGSGESGERSAEASARAPTRGVCGREIGRIATLASDQPCDRTGPL